MNSHSAIIVFGLQVYGPDHIDPDQTLLRSTLRQLSELTGRRSDAWVVWQRVHLERTLHVQEHTHIHSKALAFGLSRGDFTALFWIDSDRVLGVLNVYL